MQKHFGFLQANPLMVMLLHKVVCVGLSSKCDVTFIPLFQTVDAYKLAGQDAAGSCLVSPPVALITALRWLIWESMFSERA